MQHLGSRLAGRSFRILRNEWAVLKAFPVAPALVRQKRTTKDGTVLALIFLSAVSVAVFTRRNSHIFAAPLKKYLTLFGLPRSSHVTSENRELQSDEICRSCRIWISWSRCNSQPLRSTKHFEVFLINSVMKLILCRCMYFRVSGVNKGFAESPCHMLCIVLAIGTGQDATGHQLKSIRDKIGFHYQPR